MVAIDRSSPCSRDDVSRDNREDYMGKWSCQRGRQTRRSGCNCWRFMPTPLAGELCCWSV